MGCYSGKEILKKENRCVVYHPPHDMYPSSHSVHTSLSTGEGTVLIAERNIHLVTQVLALKKESQANICVLKGIIPKMSD
jgi:hypothetical protein